MEYPKDINGITVNVGDKVQGKGFITFQDGFKIDRSLIVTVREKDGQLFL